MKEYCWDCAKKTEFKEVKEKKTIDYLGETFEVTDEHCECLVCGGGFWLPGHHDMLAELFEAYRKKHNFSMQEWHEAHKKFYSGQTK